MKVPTWFYSYVLDPVERAASTFVQQFVVVLLAGESVSLLVGQSWLLAADSAAFAAVISLLTSIVTFMVPPLPVLADLALRVVKTFAQSLLGTLAASVVNPSVVHAPWEGALAIAIPVALAALLKGLASIAAPWSDGASLLARNDVALAA